MMNLFSVVNLLLYGTVFCVLVDCEKNINKEISTIGFNAAFTLLGVKLSFLLEDLNKWNQTFLETATTADVCAQIIKPVTAVEKCSYAEFLIRNGSSTTLGRASAFISHAWKYNFRAVMLTLQKFFSDEPETYIWMDIFSYNQHISDDKDFYWWSVTFKTAVGEIGRTVMVLEPWNDPIPLVRAWCIWELYCTIDTKATFEIAMTSESEKQFLLDMEDHPAEVIDQLFATVDVKRSESYSLYDQGQIHFAIQSTVGYDTLNKKVFEMLREWVIQRYAREFKQLNLTLGPEANETLKAENNLAVLYVMQGNQDEEVLALYEDCYNRRRNIFGKEHPGTVLSASNLASHYTHLRKFQEASKIYSEFAPSFRKLIVAGADYYFGAINQMAHFYIKMGRLSVAEKELRALLTTEIQILGNNHTKTINTMNELVELHILDSDYLQALELGMETLITSQTSLGENHRSTVRAIANLAMTYFRSGYYGKAQDLLQKVARTESMILWSDHPSFYGTLCGLAKISLELGNFHEAEEIVTKCLRYKTFLYGSESPDVLEADGILAELYEKTGNIKKQEELLLECYSKAQRIFDPLQPKLYLRSMESLGMFFLWQDRFEESEPILLEVHDKRRLFLPEDDADILASMVNLAMLHLKMGQKSRAETILLKCLNFPADLREESLVALTAMAAIYSAEHEDDQAEELLNHALRIAESKYGKYHWLTIKLLNMVAIHYKKTRQLVKAISFYCKSVERSNVSYGVNHLETLRGRLALVIVLYDHGEFQATEFELRDILPKLVDKLGDAHIDTLEAMNYLGMALKNQEKFAEALPFYEACLEKRKIMLGSSHKDTLAVMNNLAVAYKCLKRYRKARNLFEACLTGIKQQHYKSRKDTGEWYETAGTSESAWVRDFYSGEDTAGKDLILAVMNNLAGLFKHEKKVDKAEKLYLEVLAVCQSRKEDHANHYIFQALNNLGVLYFEGVRFEEAERAFAEGYQVALDIYGSDHPNTLNVAKKITETKKMRQLKEQFEYDFTSKSSVKKGEKSKKHKNQRN